MSKSTEGWSTCIVGDVIAEMKNGYVCRQSKEVNPYPITRIETISKGVVDIGRLGYAESVDPSIENFRMRKNDLLFSHINSPIHLGKTAIYHGIPETLYHGMNLLLIRAETYVEPRFLEYEFRSLRSAGIFSLNAQHAVNQASINQKKLSQLSFTLAPLNEQRRIADKLDATLARVDACRARLDRVGAILKRFRQAVLAAAVSGKLTEEWREENETTDSARDIVTQISEERGRLGFASASRLIKDEGMELPDSELPPNWLWCRVGHVADVRLGGTPARSNPQYWNGTIPWISSGEVANCRIFDTKEKITSAGVENSNAKIYPRGTVLIAMIGEGKTRGQSAILGIDAATNQNSAGIVLDIPLLEPDYIWFWALSEYEKTRDVGRGGNQPALNGAKIRALPLPLPPRAEQKEIVRRVETLFAFASRLETSLAVGNKRLVDLTPALLAKAFRGELVPQDPSDEPADALLERIRAARESAGAGGGKRGRKPRETAAATNERAARPTAEAGSGAVVKRGRGRPRKETPFDGTLGL